MNERIKEIGRTAGFAFIEDSVYGQRWYSGKCGMDAEEFEKFAELIVRECLAQVDKVDTMLEDDKEKISVAWVGLAIAKHFGVES